MNAKIVNALKFIMYVLIAGFSLMFSIASTCDFFSTKDFFWLPIALILFAVTLWSLWKLAD